jgi:hypothetical protein
MLILWIGEFFRGSLDALKNAEGQEAIRLSDELRNVTDQHAKAIRELNF